QRLGDWLIKVLRKVGFRLENVKFSHLVYALGEILAARMRLIYSEKEASENLSLFYMAVNEYKDKLKVMDIVSKIDTGEKLDFALAAKVSIETFESQEEKEKLLPLIKEELKAHGWDSKRIENLLSYIRNIFIPVRPKETPGPNFVPQPGVFNGVGRQDVPVVEKESPFLLEDIKNSYRDLGKKYNRLDKILRKSAVGMVVVDSENRIILTNKKAEDILKVNPNEIKGKTISKILKREHLLLLVQRSEDKTLEEAIFVAPEKLTEEAVNSSWAIVEDEKRRTFRASLCLG
ncbi:MAG: PAS domain S-box protein, partial [Candidatus Omnitrophica bacterium]|nr:PAS domain S-box protein [Candidatus Omnitrophota bacterium]